MMMGVVSLFLVCWLPYHTYFITANVYPAINYTHYIQVNIIIVIIVIITIITIITITITITITIIVITTIITTIIVIETGSHAMAVQPLKH